MARCEWCQGTFHQVDLGRYCEAEICEPCYDAETADRDPGADVGDVIGGIHSLGEALG
jgi:hypothetical protein